MLEKCWSLRLELFYISTTTYVSNSILETLSQKGDAKQNLLGFFLLRFYSFENFHVWPRPTTWCYACLSKICFFDMLGFNCTLVCHDQQFLFGRYGFLFWVFLFSSYFWHSDTFVNDTVEPIKLQRFNFKFFSIKMNSSKSFEKYYFNKFLKKNYDFTKKVLGNLWGNN